MIARLDSSRHKSYLLKILLDVSRDPVLSKNLVFKGWTAFLLLYGLDRFSTDLDFDLVDTNIPEKDILDRVGKILSKYGEVKELIIKRYTIFGLVSYGGIDHNIKFEINRRWLTGGYHTKSLLGIDFLVMDRADMCANKFLALLGRNKLANRDIYDVHFIIEQGFEINKERIEQQTGMNFRQYIEKMIIFLEWLGTKYNIPDGLWLVLDDDRKKWIKEHLIRETIFLLRTYFE